LGLQRSLVIVYTIMPVAVSKKKPRKSEPIAFRLNTDEDRLLSEKFGEQPVIGIDSLDKYARKLVVDVLRGKAVYLNPDDRFANPSLS